MFTRKNHTAVAVALLCLVATSAQAQERGYIKDKVRHNDPKADVESIKGDLPQDFMPGYVPSDSVAGKRARVEAYVKQEMAKDNDDVGDHGDGPPATNQEEFRNLVNEANKGSASAMYAVGQVIELGLAGNSANPATALAWYERAAEKNYRAAFSAIGNLYLDAGTAPVQEDSFFGGLRKKITGAGVQKNNKLAREWFQKGTIVGDSLSYYQLATMYRQGLGGLEQSDRLANWYTEKGKMIGKEIAQRELRQRERELRREAEEREGLLPTERAPWGQNVDKFGRPVESDGKEPGTAPTAATNYVSINGATCSYTETNLKSEGYTRVYAANCPSSLNISGSQVVVEMAGLDCVAQQNQPGGQGTHQILCKTRQEQFEIGGTVCSVQRLQAGRAKTAQEVVRLYCGGTPGITTIKSVSYLGQDCTVTPYSPAKSTDASYDLQCGPKKVIDTTEYPTAIGIAGRQCDLKKQDKAKKGDFKVVFSARCGVMSQEIRESVAKDPLTLQGMTCQLEPWPNNKDDKTFELYCR